MGVSPRVPSRCAHWVWRLSGGLSPIQRSACDYAEVSLSLCICYRLPRGATPILTHPLYRSLPKEVLARSESTWLGILTPIQGTYLPVCLFSCQCPVRDSSLFQGSLLCPLTLLHKHPLKIALFSEKTFKKSPRCNGFVTPQAEKSSLKTIMGLRKSFWAPEKLSINIYWHAIIMSMKGIPFVDNLLIFDTNK